MRRAPEEDSEVRSRFSGVNGQFSTRDYGADRS